MFSLSFLNSGILFLSSAIIIPILIYLFAKKKPKKIVFSSIRFIKESQKKQRKKINLKNLLLLLIRILIILFTVLAISRPSIKSDYLSRGTSHPKTAVAVIIDNSYSMDYLIDTKTELEEAKNLAININQLLSEDDVTTIFTFNKDWNDIHSNLRYGKIPEDIIRGIDISAVTIPLKDLIILAEERLKESHVPNQEMYIITDLQDQPLPDKIDIPTYLIASSLNSERSNISCENSFILNEIVGKENRRKLSFEIVNHSSIPQNDIIIQLNIDGHTIAEKVTDLNPGQKKNENFDINLDTEGWLTGYVEVKNERLAFDNRNYFTFYYNPEPKVGVITDLAELPLSLETVAEIYTGNRSKIDLITKDDYNYESLKNYDNIIIYKKNELNTRLSFMIDKLIQDNEGVLFITDPHLSPEWQGKFTEIFPITFKGFLNDGKKKFSTFINPYHPVTELLSHKDNIEFGEIWSIDADSNILIQSGEHPLVIEKNKLILWLFDIADLRNPFIIDSAFPVFAYNCLQYMVSNSVKGISQIAGGKIKIRHNQVVLPSGDMILWNQEHYTTSESGIYYFNQQPIAVNLDYKESTYKQFENKKRDRITILRDNWENEILQSRYGFEIWKYLLLAVLILFILEMLLIKSEERK